MLLFYIQIFRCLKRFLYKKHLFPFFFLFFPSNFDYNNKGEQPEMIIDLYFRLFSNNITTYPSQSWRWWLIDPSFMSMSLRMND